LTRRAASSAPCTGELDIDHAKASHSPASRPQSLRRRPRRWRGGPPGQGHPYDNPEPTNWPDIRQRIANAERYLSDLEVLTENPRSSQELIGFTAQQAVENALKGWISALDADYRNTHDLMKLAAIVRQHPTENDTSAGERLAWLTEYAVRYRYVGAEVVMDDRFVLLAAVTETVAAILARIRALGATEEENFDPEMGQQNSSTKPDESTAE